MRCDRCVEMTEADEIPRAMGQEHQETKSQDESVDETEFLAIKNEPLASDEEFTGSDLELLTALGGGARLQNGDRDDEWRPKKPKKRKKDKKSKGSRKKMHNLIEGCPELIVVTPQFNDIIIKDEPTDSIEETILDAARREVEQRWLECVSRGEVNNPASRVDGRYKIQKLPQAEIDILSRRLQRQRRLSRGGKNKRFPCKKCEMTFDVFADLRAHTLIHQTETRHKCNECGKCFTRSCDLTLHRRTHSQVKAFVCTFCDRGFTQKINMIRHVKSVHENVMDRPFHCDLCLQTFVGRGDLRKHLLRHEGPNRFFCPTCAIRFMSDEEMRLHQADFNHGPDMWLCRACNLVVSRSNRKLHMDTHPTIPKPYLCNYCNMSFTYKYALAKHIPVHTGVRAFVCRYCGADFATEPSHRSHVIRHTLLKELRCSLCEKVFYTSNALSKHLKIHSDERNYKCSSCPSSFKMSDALKKHETIHEKARLRFRCSHPGCAVSLTTKSNMERHVASIHLGIRRHKCQYCQRGYSMRCDSVRHEVKCPKNPDNKDKPICKRMKNPEPLTMSEEPTPERIYVKKEFVEMEEQAETILGDVDNGLGASRLDIVAEKEPSVKEETETAAVKVYFRKDICENVAFQREAIISNEFDSESLAKIATNDTSDKLTVKQEGIKNDNNVGEIPKLILRKGVDGFKRIIIKEEVVVNNDVPEKVIVKEEVMNVEFEMSEG